MDEKKVQQKICELAKQLAKEKSTFSRADLAYELKSLGVKADSSDVERLVWEAYTATSDKKILGAFIANDGSMSLVDAYQLTHLLLDEDVEQAFALVKKLSDETERRLRDLDKSVALAKKIDAIEATAGLMDTVKGTAGVKEVSEVAKKVFDKYSDMVDAYLEAKACVKTDVANFVDVRTDIAALFQKYAMALVDVYGDAVRVIDPELFDFESIQWLDVESMLKNAQLDYDKVAENCATLMSEISEHFRDTFTAAISTYKSTSANNKSVGLALATIGMIDHYMQASSQTAVLRSELSKLKMSVKHDTTHIQGDMGRLLVIHKTLNDLYYPKAQVFYNFASQLMASDFAKIQNMLYASDKAKALRTRREMLLLEIASMQRELNDHNESIPAYQSTINSINAQIKNSEKQYHEAKAQKPEKPFLCIGPWKTSYNRSLTEWFEVCEPVIRAYEDMKVEQELASEELKSHKNSLKKLQPKLIEKRMELKKLTDSMLAEVAASDQLKSKMFAYVKPIVGMLQIAKEIAEAGLEGNLTNVVEIKDFRNVQLPADTEQNYQEFALALKENVQLDETSLRQLVDDAYDTNLAAAAMDGTSVDPVVTNAVVSGAAALDSYIKLQLQVTKEEIAEAEYDKQLKQLQDGFAANLKAVKNQTAYLGKVIAKLKAADGNEDAIRKAILELSGNRVQLTEEDFNQMLKGNKTIEI